MTPEREEALRLARHDPASAGIFYVAQESQDAHEALLDALAADLEAAERRVSKLEGDLDVSIQTGKLLVEQREAAERNLATAREALKRELHYTHGEETKRRIRDALRSLGEQRDS